MVNLHSEQAVCSECFTRKFKNMNNSGSGLNDVQMTLLRLFNHPMSEKEQTDIKEMLLNYYDNVLQNEVQHVIKQKGYSEKDFEKVLNNSQRTKV
jgi:hypothetical protein